MVISVNTRGSDNLKKIYHKVECHMLKLSHCKIYDSLKENYIFIIHVRECKVYTLISSDVLIW